jgi:hypothetical protein
MKYQTLLLKELIIKVHHNEEGGSRGAGMTWAF